ncbi:MAG TPA: ABC transporter ATP-binding protein [Chloroflexi bacterium]|nr:ABC transporter ATP-binding protein [Chloroflexota bacterium]
MSVGESAELVLKIEDLYTSFHTQGVAVKAVDGISLDIRSSEVFGLVGESGSGKSVTALSIMRLISPPGMIEGGRIIFKGRDLLELSESEMREVRGDKISMIFQDPAAFLNPIMRVGKQIAEPLTLHRGMNRSQARKRVLELMDLVGIPDPEQRIDDYPHQLSGGMRQRVLIATALACQPDILIADEPTTALDVTIQAQILDLLRDLQSTFGSSVVLITHDLGVIAEMCHRVAVMYAGQVMEVADTEALLNNPQHPYTAALLESLPQLGRRKERLRVIPGSVPSAVTPPSGCRFHPRCSRAEEICRIEVPPLIRLANGRQAACHRCA